MRQNIVELTCLLLFAITLFVMLVDRIGAERRTPVRFEFAPPPKRPRRDGAGLHSLFIHRAETVPWIPARKR